jgi:serine/threonine protein kinase
MDILIEKDKKRSTKELKQAQLRNNFGTCTIDPSEFTVDLNVILGSGAFATVYAGQYQGEEAAVKVFDLTNMPIEVKSKLKKSMAKELQVMKQLNESPKIIRMFGCCEMPMQQKLMLLMERAVGGTVAALLSDKQRPLSDDQKRSIIYETSLGMKYLYSKGVMHRDLKAANLLLSDKGRVKVSDFGISFAASTNTTTKTTTSTSAGTTPWMAPELLQVPPAPFSEECDVYSFGIVVWEVMARDTTPYPGLQQVQVDSARCRGGEEETIT